MTGEKTKSAASRIRRVLMDAVRVDMRRVVEGKIAIPKLHPCSHWPVDVGSESE